MIYPKVPAVRSGQILSANLVNSMIGRIEYAADLLRQYKLIAGDEMYVEPHFDGTRVSYFQPVKGGASPALPVPKGKLASAVTLRASAIDVGEILTWSITGSVASARLLPFPGLSSTRARMSGNTITVDPEDTSDRKFIVVINGSDLNNFSITKTGTPANGTIIDATFEKSDGTSFRFSDFCGIRESSIGQVEAFGTCFFYPNGPPPGTSFDGVGNYWLISSGANMTFSINTEKEEEYSATEALSVFSSIVDTTNIDAIYFDFSDLGPRQIVFEMVATGTPTSNQIFFRRTSTNTFFRQSFGFFKPDGTYVQQATINASVLSGVLDKKFYITFPFTGVAHNLRLFLS